MYIFRVFRCSSQSFTTYLQEPSDTLVCHDTMVENHCINVRLFPNHHINNSCMIKFFILMQCLREASLLQVNQAQRVIEQLPKVCRWLSIIICPQYRQSLQFAIWSSGEVDVHHYGDIHCIVKYTLRLTSYSSTVTCDKTSTSGKIKVLFRKLLHNRYI